MEIVNVFEEEDVISTEVYHVDKIKKLKNKIESTGKVCRNDIRLLEGSNEGFITNKYPLNSFTEIDSTIGVIGLTTFLNQFLKDD